MSFPNDVSWAWVTRHPLEVVRRKVLSSSSPDGHQLCKVYRSWITKYETSSNVPSIEKQHFELSQHLNQQVSFESRRGRYVPYFLSLSRAQLRLMLEMSHTWRCEDAENHELKMKTYLGWKRSLWTFYVDSTIKIHGFNSNIVSSQRKRTLEFTDFI